MKPMENYLPTVPCTFLIKQGLEVAAYHREYTRENNYLNGHILCSPGLTVCDRGRQILIFTFQAPFSLFPGQHSDWTHLFKQNSIKHYELGSRCYVCKKPTQTPTLSNPNYCFTLAPNTICLDNNTSVKETMQKESLPFTSTKIVIFTKLLWWDQYCIILGVYHEVHTKTGGMKKEG